MNFKVRILDEHKGTARSRACCSTPPTAPTSGARSACPRTSSRPRGRRWSTRWSAACSPGGGRPRRAPAARPPHDATREDPARAAGARPAEESACSRSCARAAVARPAPARIRGGLRARLGAPHASAVSSDPPACTWRCGRSGWRTGDEVVTTPFSFVASANAILYERASPVFADIDPVTLNIDPGAAAAAVRRAHGGAAAGPHLRLAGRHARAGRRSGCRSSRLPAGARRLPRRRDADGRPRPPSSFAFYANKQITTGEGHGHDVDRGRRGAAGLRAQPGARARHGLARPRPAGLQLPPLRPPCALGMAQLERLDELLAGRERVADLYRRRRWTGSRAWSRCPAPSRRRPAQLVRLRRPAAARGGSATRGPPLRRAGWLQP